MAKAVADVNDPLEKQGGFASGNSDITGFSHMHDSGTGGVCRTPANEGIALTFLLGTITWKLSFLPPERLPG
jgi:hypothetical protein